MSPPRARNLFVLGGKQAKLKNGTTRESLQGPAGELNTPGRFFPAVGPCGEKNGGSFRIGAGPANGPENGGRLVARPEPEKNE